MNCCDAGQRTPALYINSAEFMYGAADDDINGCSQVTSGVLTYSGGWVHSAIIATGNTVRLCST